MLNSSLKNPNDEEFQKNCIKDFLRDSFGYSCNTRGKVDLAIYDDEIPKVLFEVKSLGNKAEFVKSPKDLSSKALYESILYYLRECHKHKNNNIKHIVLCTAKEFYILKATDYHRLFAKNKDIERAYNNCDFNEGNDTSTARFYKQVESIIEDIEGELEFCYISVESALKNQNSLALLYALLSPNFLLQIPRYIDANTLNERFYKELLYILGLVQVEQNGKALIRPSTTPNTLLRSIKRDFADKLPRDLSESSDSNALDSGQNISDSPKSTQNPNYPRNSTDIFDSHIFPLIMLWNNRILFLRLLESMLLSFRHITKPFLDISILGDFGALNTLFFKVLAVKNRADIPPNLADIPYLNSSLFEKSALESQGFEIATLQSKPLKIAPDSILRRDKDLRQRYIGNDECLPLLEYLFAFLHAYDFTTTPSDIANNAKTNHDKLINSAVLGLVFEKLNGYKEGSFYTPSFITRYMCENSLRKIVLEKFNQANPKWQCKTIADIEYEIHREIRQARNAQNSSSQGQRQKSASTSSLRGSGDSHNEAIQSYRHSEGAKRPKNPRIKGEFLDSSLRTSCYAQNDESIIDCHESANADSRNDGFVKDSNNDSTKEILAKYNKIFLSIRICDPAVGSGHFLVSALNELIALKSELGLLLDCDGVRLSDIDLVLENDELLIKDSQGKMLDYTIPAHERVESHKIQKALFYTKKELIENCLFGVDINPNSVEICKLRLWIELLKYSYYENIATKELQTLPNIDINIKCGNSLISYFDLRQSLSHYPNIAVKIKQYQQAVRDYKEGIFANRNQINATIKELLQSFRNFCFSDKFKKEIKSFHAKCESYSKKYGNFLAKDDENLRLYVAQSFGYFDFDEDKARADFAILKKEYESIFSLETNKPFEWRFEFPEVLNENGDFMGFDLIIDNPPYIKEADNKRLFENTKKLRTYQGKMDIWYHFVGKGFDLVKNQGIVTFIATNNWTTNAGAQKLRNIILSESQILNLVDFGSYMCFDSASIQTMIMEFRKSKSIPKSYTINYAKIESQKPTDEHRKAVLKREIFDDNIYLTPTITPKELLDKTLSFVDSDKDLVLNKILKSGKFYLQKNEVWQGLVHPQPTLDKVMIENLKEQNQTCNVGDGVFNLSIDEIKGIALSKKEKDLLKPYYEATHLLKYYGISQTNIYVIYTDSSFKKPNSMDKYPNLKKHLDKFQSIITSDNKPYGLHRARKQDIFEGNKILSRVKCVDCPIFTYVNFDCYVGLNFNIIKTNRIDMKYLVGILNSKLVAFWLKHKGKMQGNNYQINQEPLLNIPILEPNAKNQKIADEIVNLVDKILESKAQGKDSTTLESQIDDLVYKLYNLDSKEIQIIKGD